MAQDAFKNARILIIDDEATSAELLARMLERAGYAICITISDPTVAANRFRQIQPDIVLLDLHMEPISGIEVLGHICNAMSPPERPPVLVLTADTSPEAKHEALEAGATDFLSKPLDQLEVLLRIDHLLTTRSLFFQCQSYSMGLEQLVSARTAELQLQTHELETALAELEATQQQVIQQERLRALGTMASGIAHDLNNGLSLILGYGDMLLSQAERSSVTDDEREQLGAIVRAALDNVQMVRRLRDFYRPRAVHEDRQPVNLNEVVKESISLTAPRWQAEAESNGASISIVTDLGDLPLIAGAPAELREVLTNLIFNSVDAMPQGGRLTFRTLARSGIVELTVSDTGVGMNENTRKQCIEPFYTTKGERGSGLGLAMSYGIIRRHSGTVAIESHPNAGTTFTIRLPVCEDPVAIVPDSLGQLMRPLRVLVVDDHPGILEIVSAYLAEDRHTVETAGDARMAMEKFQASPFDLIITDRAMPEINGDEFAASVKRIDPDKPVIMLTGFADAIHEMGQRSENVDLVLGKPARLADLRQAILQVMVAAMPTV